MPTQLDIYNRAMSAMGGSPTIASTAETSTNAVEIARHYDAVRKEALESTLWTFARRTANLGTATKTHPSVTGSAATGTEWGATWPQPPWLYQWAVPSDFLRARYVMPSPGVLAGATLSPAPSTDWYHTMNVPYQFQVSSDTDADVILTNFDNAVLIYTADVTEPNAWSSMFTQLVVWMLAARAGPALNMDLELVKLNTLQAQDMWNRAAVMNANQGITPTAHLPEWLKARGVSPVAPDAGYLP